LRRGNPSPGDAGTFYVTMVVAGYIVDSFSAASG